MAESVLQGILDVATAPPSDLPEEELVRLYREGQDWTGDDRAYDGSNAPSTRDLTARERDVLCGLISDLVGEALRTNSAAHVRGGSDWLNHLIVIRDVIDPRRQEEEDVD